MFRRVYQCHVIGKKVNFISMCPYSMPTLNVSVEIYGQKNTLNIHIILFTYKFIYIYIYI